MKQEKSAKPRDEGWEPSVPDPDLSKKEGRSFDIGESGQFAPGGYYNQLNKNLTDLTAAIRALREPAASASPAGRSNQMEGAK